MVAHCANENCRVRLHSFSEGRLFQFDIVSVSMSAGDVSDGDTEDAGRKQSAQFWLCGKCAGLMTLVMEPAQALKLIPLGMDPPSVPADTETLNGNC
jgi:hypothetical protein